MKITIKDTEHAKIYYPQLIGKTFENCKDLEYNNFIEIPHQKDEGSQWIIIKDDCTILEKDSIISEIAPILKELELIKNNLISFTTDKDTIINEKSVKYLYAIEKSANNIKEKYNDMLRSHE